MVTLDGRKSSSKLIGRHEDADVRLHTRTTSRRHARLTRRSNGYWYLEPLAEKTVQIDGRDGEPEVLMIEGMVLQLGDDELRVGSVPAGSRNLSRVVITVGIGIALLALATLAGLVWSGVM